MRVVAGDMPIADLLEGLERKAIRVNHTYQRQSRIWPPAAQGFLIETILLGFPITKFSMHQQTDIASRISVKEIVDGQQRTHAIQAFVAGSVALPRNSELIESRGLRFEQLPPALRQEFLEYPLDVDLFVATTSEQVREVFRRINSYTVPLNPEEQRHARYQGEFKWLVHRTASRVGESLRSLGTLSERQLVRMADAKLVTETYDALVNGISTTNKGKLDAIYRRFDPSLPVTPQLEGRIEAAIAWLQELDLIKDTELAKQHQMYSLILATTHLQDPVEALADDLPLGLGLDPDAAVRGLSTLLDELEGEAATTFVQGSEKATNTGENRRRRFKAFVGALSGVQV